MDSYTHWLTHACIYIFTDKRLQMCGEWWSGRVSAGAFRCSRNRFIRWTSPLPLLEVCCFMPPFFFNFFFSHISRATRGDGSVCLSLSLWSRLKYLDSYWMDCNKTLNIEGPQRTNHTDFSGALFPVAPPRGWCLVRWNFVWHSLCSKIQI